MSNYPTPSTELLCGQFCSIRANEQNSYCSSNELLIKRIHRHISVILLLNQITHLLTLGYAFGKQRDYLLYTEMLVYKWLILKLFYYINLSRALLNCQRRQKVLRLRHFGGKDRETAVWAIVWDVTVAFVMLFSQCPPPRGLQHHPFL